MFAALLMMTGLMTSSINPLNQFHWEGHIAAGQSIEINNTYGSILAEPALGDHAEIVAHRAGQPEQTVDFKIGLVEDETGIRIRAIQPGGSDRDVRVDFTIRVPKGVRFVGRTINGSVEANRLTGDAAAYTVNGDVRLSTTGEGQAETVNGSINACFGQSNTGRDLKFSSVNGGIFLRMPRRLNARLHASTLHGGITADFPITEHSNAAGRSASVLLGHGGPELKLTTVNGNIRLVRVI